MQRCKSKFCLLACAWLWISGLALMGKIIVDLNAMLASLETRIAVTDAQGSLQILFLLYTVICVALYFAWRRAAELKNHQDAPGPMIKHAA